MLYSDMFRKGVGGQRGLAQGNPSHTIDSGPFSAPLAYVKESTTLGEKFCYVFKLGIANPLPPTPFPNL